MCGICGIYNFKDDDSVDRTTLQAMNDIITHRGPDDDGFHVDGAVGLGMRRLIIIDPETGQQPLYSEDKNIALVFNGEIYNFQSLREQLIDRGHQFASRSDGEVIVHLYEEHGLSFIDRLRGMFAFALWDRNKNQLLVARDRVGIKPLYYAEHEGTLLFASEIKSILQHPTFPRQVNRSALHHYLSLNYVPAPLTLLQGVSQLHPGEYLLCNRDGVVTKAYWDLEFISKNSLGEKEWANKVRDKLRECVSTHLVSDVPFGSFLSGGIDSSAVVALMSQSMNEPVSTFSIDFEEKSYGEGKYARMIAEMYGSEHHELLATPDVVSLLETLIWHADDPLADSSMIPVYMLSEFAKKHVAMVLTGDGGDEVFAGYETYNAYYVRNMYRKIPPWVRRHLIKSAVDSLPVSLTKVSFDFKAKRFVEGAELDAEEAHFWWRVILSESAKRQLYSAGMRDAMSETKTSDLYKHYFDKSNTDDPLSRMLYADTRFYLPSDMLVKVDRMTMANGLEARVPFLDHEMVEFGATIPSSIKFKQKKKKHILKKALGGLVPDEILYRKKAGFNVPINTWLTGNIRQMAHDLLAPDRIGESGFFSPEYVQTLLREQQARKADHSYAIWGLMCFQVWYERFIQSPSVRPPRPVAERWGLDT